MSDLVDIYKKFNLIIGNVLEETLPENIDKITKKHILHEIVEV